MIDIHTIMFIIPIFLMVDGIVSILLQLDDKWYYQPGRVVRTAIGFFLSIMGGFSLCDIVVLFVVCFILSVDITYIIKLIEHEKTN